MVDSNYKLVFIPWMLEAASDVSQFNQIVENTFRFFGETNQIDEELYSPVNFILKQNYPNPFNATTIIQYKIPVDADVVLNIYNINGQMVDQLVNQHQKEGQYSVDWSSANMPSGIYFYWLQVDNQCQTKKMVVMK